MSSALDHRHLADEMELFFLDEQIGAGLPVWLPNGVVIRDELEAYVKRLEDAAGYGRVVSPHVARAELYHRSGHIRAFRDSMYPAMREPDGGEYFLKPMNCPHHHKVFAAKPRSYRQMPLRLAEYGQVYRYEHSGSLRGLSRVRGLCQNDAHIYVDPGQSLEEVRSVLRLHERCYRDLGLKGYSYRLSLCEEARMHEFDGSIEDWRRAEWILREALQHEGLAYFEAVGEAAFYGPKIDVQMPIRGVSESIASVQLDFNSGAKFDLSFADAAGGKQVPWVIHRAPLGSHERFVAMLLEYFEGRLPGWLAPVQILLLPVAEAAQAQASALASAWRGRGLRVEVDSNQGSLSKRIRFAHRLRPFAKIILGEKEIASGRAQLELRSERFERGLDEIGGAVEERLGRP